MRKGGYAILLAALAMGPAAQAANEEFDSVIHAVNDANALGYAWLAKGVYQGGAGPTRVTIEVPSDMRSSLAFDMRRRTVRSAEWVFDKPILVTITSGGQCVRVSVKRLKYGPGGLPMPNSTDTTIVPGPGNTCNTSEAMLALDDVLAINEDPNELFKGALFTAAGSMKKCSTPACTASTAGGPIARVKFIGGVNNGAEVPAFSVGFREGSTLLFPGQSYVKLGPNSGAIFDGLDYDLRTSKGKGDLSRLSIPVEDGVIASGTTILRLTALSSLSAQAMKVSTEGASFKLENGSITGRLGEGTNVVLSSQQGRLSSLYLLGADVDLNGIHLSDDGSGPALRVRRGSFKTKLKSAELWFTSDASIRLDYTNLDFVIGCTPADPASCVGVEWSSKGVVVKGTISNFATNISGGQFPLSEAGMTEIKSGKINTGVLTLDSTDPVSPIVGPITDFAVSFEGQDLFLDGQTRIKAARVDLESRDLAFVKGEALPTGNLLLKGDITRFEASGLGTVTTIDGSLNMKVRRLAADSPEFHEGEITAKSRVRLEGTNYAEGTLEMRDLRYYKGYGEAKGKLTIDKAQYAFQTPGDSKSDSNTLARVKVNVRAADVTAELRNGVVLGPFEVESSHSEWKVDPIKDVPFALNVRIPKHELVYAPIELKATGSTLCAPKVNLAGQTKLVQGKVDIDANSAGGRVLVHSITSDGPVDADVDDRGCSEVAALICGLVGSVAGPIGTVALAMICNGKVEDAEAGFEENIRTLSTEEVKTFKYDYTW